MAIHNTHLNKTCHRIVAPMDSVFIRKATISTNLLVSVCVINSPISWRRKRRRRRLWWWWKRNVNFCFFYFSCMVIVRVPKINNNIIYSDFFLILLNVWNEYKWQQWSREGKRKKFTFRESEKHQTIYDGQWLSYGINSAIFQIELLFINILDLWFTLVLIQHVWLILTIVRGMGELVIAPSMQNFLSIYSNRAKIRFDTCSNFSLVWISLSYPPKSFNICVCSVFFFFFRPHFMERIEIIIARVCHLMMRSF